MSEEEHGSSYVQMSGGDAAAAAPSSSPRPAASPVAAAQMVDVSISPAAATPLPKSSQSDGLTAAMLAEPRNMQPLPGSRSERSLCGARTLKARLVLAAYSAVCLIATFICVGVYVDSSSSAHDCTQEPLVQQAMEVLNTNWRDRNTIPSPTLYPHQWSWDSAFIAIGYSWFQQERGQQELTSLFDAQWHNGMVPHIVFNPAIPSDSYWPGPGFWNCTNAAPTLAPTAPLTSGIIQPPVHATAARALLERATDRKKALSWLRDIYPKLVAWMDYLYRERDVDGDGLVYIRHPWESGMDNSPNWDAALERIVLHPGDVPPYHRADTHRPGVNPADRPTDWTYDRFVYLVELAKKHHYNEYSIREVSPFLVDDVLFNAILARANADMVYIARVLDQFSDVQRFQRRYWHTFNAINTKLWDGASGMFYDFDETAGALVKEPVGGNLVAAYAGIGLVDDATMPGGAGSPQALGVVAQLQSGSFCGPGSSCTPLPSYSVTATNFSTHNYWRGPVWINVNWLMYNGLASMAGAADVSKRLQDAIFTIVGTQGFWEYFDPYTLSPHGTDGFSWTASLYIDLQCSTRHPSKSTALHEAPSRSSL